jgi:hypothetical protein
MCCRLIGQRCGICRVVVMMPNYEMQSRVSRERRRFGCRRIHVMIAREGFEMNHKKVRRIYREEKLQVRRRGGRKRALGTRKQWCYPPSLCLHANDFRAVDGPNQRWSLDFVSDALPPSRQIALQSPAGQSMDVASAYLQLLMTSAVRTWCWCLPKTRRTDTVPVICLLASCTPCRDLLREKPPFAAILGQISFVQRRRFQHSCELVARRPTDRPSVRIRQKLSLAARMATPRVQRPL